MKSRATKSKYMCVVKDVVGDFPLPQENQRVVKVGKTRGSNLREVIDAAGMYFLVSVPTKYRKTIWINKNDYVLIPAIEEGKKVKGEITAILYKKQIKYIKENNLWPAAFKDQSDEEPIDNTHSMLPPTYDTESETEEDSEQAADSHNNSYSMQCNARRDIRRKLFLD